MNLGVVSGSRMEAIQWLPKNEFPTRLSLSELNKLCQKLSEEKKNLPLQCLQAVPHDGGGRINGVTAR